MKLTFKNERDVVDLASDVADSAVCFYPAESELAHKFLAGIRNGHLDQRERPDFEDLTSSILLEAMAVDDHPRPGKKDRTRAREGAVLREIAALGLDVHEDATVMAAVSSGLPTDQDHNYAAYIQQFARTVSDHARKADAYRSERLGFKLGFLIFDEATAYFETLDASGRSGIGRPHFWFADSEFVEVMRHSGADCFVWVTPHKRLHTADAGEIPLPMLTIIDVALLAQTSSRVYSAERMVSAEV
ncbi:hypothetical protein [Microbacterium sp. NPDC055665]